MRSGPPTTSAGRAVLSEPVIECRGLCHAYGSRPVLFDLDFDVPTGRILGLLGKNGAGKKTTMS